MILVHVGIFGTFPSSPSDEEQTVIKKRPWSVQASGARL